DVAAAVDRLDDPLARDLIGEARMLNVVAGHLYDRLAQGLASGRLHPESGALGRLYDGVSTNRLRTIAFEIAGAAGGAWTDDDNAASICGVDFLMRQVSCIGGGTTEIARIVISERVLGMPREPALDRDLPFREVPRSPAR